MGDSLSKTSLLAGTSLFQCLTNRPEYHLHRVIPSTLKMTSFLVQIRKKQSMELLKVLSSFVEYLSCYWLKKGTTSTANVSKLPNKVAPLFRRQSVEIKYVWRAPVSVLYSQNVFYIEAHSDNSSSHFKSKTFGCCRIVFFYANKAAIFKLSHPPTTKLANSHQLTAL